MHLVERDAPLERLDALLAESATSGQLVFVAGEAGNGKTTLVREWLRRQPEVTPLIGACDGSLTPRPLGPFVDAFPQLAAIRETDRTAMLNTVLPDLTRANSVLVIEDLHWADDGSLDLLRALASRLASMRALVIATLRSDEVELGTPLETLIGDYATRPDVSTIELQPLTLEGVRTLATQADAQLDTSALFVRTGGNAFHTTEILATPSDDLPTTVRDAVRARVARLSPEARQSLDVVALSGLRAEPALLIDVLGAQAETIDEAVRRGVLVEQADGIRFRHELARSAIADDVPPMRRIAIHRDILRWLLAHGGDSARIASHAELAGEHDVAFTASVDAARESARLSSHRAAVSQYERALRLAPKDYDDRVTLLEELSYEQYLTSNIDDAITTRAMALAIHEADENHIGIISGHRWLSRLHWFNTNGPGAHEHGRRAVELLRPDDRNREAAMALSNMASLRMLTSDVEGARLWGNRALAIAEELGALDIVAHALNNIGTAEMVDGLWDEGRPKLTRSLELSLEHDFEEHAARAYTNLTSAALERQKLDDCDAWLEPALTYCIERDLDAWLLYMQGHQAELRVAQGRFDEALAVADRVLNARAASSVCRFGALIARGLVQLRTGDPAATETLTQAEELAIGSGEVQRLDPAARALAEAAWLAGDKAPDLLRDACTHPDVISAPVRLGLNLGWLAHFDDVGEVPVELPAPSSYQVEGRWHEAAEWWRDHGFPYEQALALAETGEVDALAQAVRILNDLGATATAAAVGARLVALGGTVPRPKRTATRNHPAGLTARESEVLELLAAGCTNAEIAQSLTVSTRTVENHVAALLLKLGVNSRRDAANLAIERGWVAVERPVPLPR